LDVWRKYYIIRVGWGGRGDEGAWKNNFKLGSLEEVLGYIYIIEVGDEGAWRHTFILESLDEVPTVLLQV